MSKSDSLFVIIDNLKVKQTPEKLIKALRHGDKNSRLFASAFLSRLAREDKTACITDAMAKALRGNLENRDIEVACDAALSLGFFADSEVGRAQLERIGFITFLEEGLKQTTNLKKAAVAALSLSYLASAETGAKLIQPTILQLMMSHLTERNFDASEELKSLKTIFARAFNKIFSTRTGARLFTNSVTSEMYTALVQKTDFFNERDARKWLEEERPDLSPSKLIPLRPRKEKPSGPQGNDPAP